MNGPVQGTGADIIKIAMAKCYGHVMKRGWEDKVYLLATMHDELVFEIDGDILEEAISELEGIMTTNNIILSKKWPIPFTSDVEIGVDWTVPWDLGKLENGKKEWPDVLEPLFQSSSKASFQPKKEDVVKPSIEKEKKEAAFFSFELEEISMKLVYELGDKIKSCVGEVPLVLTYKGQPIPVSIEMKVDPIKFKQKF